MRFTAIFTVFAATASMAAARSGSGYPESDLGNLYARDAANQEAWVPLARRDADAEADLEAWEDLNDLHRRMSDVFNAAVAQFDNYHRKREGRMSRAEERQCEDECKKTYDNQIKHATRLKISTSSIKKDYESCKKWCQTH